MYTRDFYQDEQRITIPENYDGTLLSKEVPSAKEESEHVSKMVENKESVPSWFEKIQLNKLFPSFPRFFKKEFTFGSEELIIIGVIAFLVFTKSADIECILILAALLFV